MTQSTKAAIAALLPKAGTHVYTVNVVIVAKPMGAVPSSSVPRSPGLPLRKPFIHMRMTSKTVNTMKTSTLMANRAMQRYQAQGHGPCPLSTAGISA